MTRLQTIPAIVTAYRKFMFRSRLEAKWAVFFDLCGWQWSYEPPEFPGWVPDFAIGERPTLVEVKPFWNAADWDDQVKKILASECKQDVVLLGADAVWLAATGSQGDQYQVGWLLDVNGELWDLHFGITEGNGKPGLCAMGGAWVNHIWKAPPYSPTCTHPNKWSRVWCSNPEEELVNRWAQACNVSKWIPKHEPK